MMVAATTLNEGHRSKGGLRVTWDLEGLAAAKGGPGSALVRWCEAMVKGLVRWPNRKMDMGLTASVSNRGLRRPRRD